jgi:hypothetical protein
MVMKSGARVAMGVAAGYLLGRTRKMRLALMIAAAGATGVRGGSPGVLLKRGLGQLSSVPEVAKLTETAKNELLDAAKAAAVTAATKRVTALSGRMQEQIRDRSADEDEDTDDNVDADEVDEQDESRERPKRRGRARADREGEADDTDEDSGGGEADEAPRRRRVSARAGSSDGRSPVRRGGR